MYAFQIAAFSRFIFDADVSSFFAFNSNQMRIFLKSFR